jgi:serine O-acetyltransferase
MDESFINQLWHSHQDCTKCPPAHEVRNFYRGLLGLLFPPYAETPLKELSDVHVKIDELRVLLRRILYRNLLEEEEHLIEDAFFDSLPEIYRSIQMDVTAMYEGDPAARSEDEVIRAYPGFYAISAYRIAHRLADLGVETIPRMITEHAHDVTGIDIHPNAEIGEYFCIDHGTGVVIGETTHIGNHVKIYQGVTLGALSVSKEDASTKRHPTIGDHVVLYAGATILGGNTIVGEGSVIGGNVWLTQSVPPNSKIYYKATMSHTTEGTTDTVIIK